MNPDRRPGYPSRMPDTTHVPGADDYGNGAGPARAPYDEAFAGPGEPRPSYRHVLDALGRSDLDAVTDEVNASLADRDVTFGGDDPHPFRVDPVPRILTGEEWERLTRGLRQRVRALDALVEDAYGEQRAVRAGVVPERVVVGSSYYERDLEGHQPPGAWLGIAGIDVVRDADGRFRVLEDNTRTPSGISYALAAADAVAEVLGVDHDGAAVRRELRALLRQGLEASAPDVEGELVLLSDGPDNSAWFDHRTLASIAGLELVGLSDLRRRGERIELADGRRVRAVYRRTDQDEVREPSGELTPIAELMLPALKAGQVGMTNRFGAGVADDKNVYAYVDDLVRFYLDEEPEVPSVATYDLLDEARREHVLDRLDELVVKPRDGQGGEGVVVGPTAGREEIATARAAIAEAPEDWVVQDVVTLSTHPTVVDGALEPRHVDLRVFVFCRGRDASSASVPPLGLTRVALEPGSMVVNSSRDGGAKATWVAA